MNKLEDVQEIVVDGKIRIVAKTKNTVYAIVYATDSKILRRVIVPDRNWHLFNGWRKWLSWICPWVTRFVLPEEYHGGGFHPCGHGETMLFAPAGFNDEMPEWENHIFNATGVVVPDSTCALIDPYGYVVNFVRADPALDAAPDGHEFILLNGRFATLGHYFTGYRFLPPMDNVIEMAA